MPPELRRRCSTTFDTSDFSPSHFSNTGRLCQCWTVGWWNKIAGTGDNNRCGRIELCEYDALLRCPRVRAECEVSVRGECSSAGGDRGQRASALPVDNRRAPALIFDARDWVDCSPQSSPASRYAFSLTGSRASLVRWVVRGGALAGCSDSHPCRRF